jgi:hypothetical protein
MRTAKPPSSSTLSLGPCTSKCQPCVPGVLLLMLITSILVRPVASAVSLQRLISRTGAGTWSIMCMYGAGLMHNLRSTSSLGPVFRNREPLMALDLTCDSGGSYLYPDEYTCWLEGCMQANPTVPLTAAGMP